MTIINIQSKRQPVWAISPFTMQDFPDHTACIIWFAGCNLRCHYCHNPEMISVKEGKKHLDDVWDFLQTRTDKLDGVVLSGGEATTFPELVNVAENIKTMGFKVKLDTNGTRPEVVSNMLNKKVVDYIALDYKAPNASFAKVTGMNKFNKLQDTLKLLCSQEKVPFEVRTTVHSSLMGVEDISTIITDLDKLGYSGTYYIQNYRHSDNLGNMAEQEFQLKREHITKPKGFALDWRNF